MRNFTLLILILTTGLAAAQPVVTGTSDYDPTSDDAPQWISIFGTGFNSTSLVTLTFGRTEFQIPAHLTEFYNDGHLRIRIGVLPEGPRWSVSVRNDTGVTSSDGQLPAASQLPPDEEPEHAPISEATIPDTPPGPIYVLSYPTSLQPETYDVTIRSTEPEILTPTDTRQWITIVGQGFVDSATVQWGYSTPYGHEWDSAHLETVYVDSTRLMIRSELDASTTIGRLLRVVNPDGKNSNVFTPSITSTLDYILPPVLIDDERLWRADGIVRKVEQNTQAAYALLSAIGLAHIQYDCMLSTPRVTNRPSILLWRIPVEDRSAFVGEYALNIVYCFALTNQTEDTVRRIDRALDRIGLEHFNTMGAGSETGWTPWQASAMPLIYKDFYNDYIEYAPETKSLILTFDETFWLR